MLAYFQVVGLIIIQDKLIYNSLNLNVIVKKLKKYNCASPKYNVKWEPFAFEIHSVFETKHATQLDLNSPIVIIAQSGFLIITQ